MCSDAHRMNIWFRFAAKAVKNRVLVHPAVSDLLAPGWVGGSLGVVASKPVLTAVMFAEAKASPSNSELLKNSLLYRHFHAQREEVLKHKWYESERAGYDIGFDRALTDWAIKHRAEWLKKRQLAAEPGGIAAS
jgi:hypothetical protein